MIHVTEVTDKEVHYMWWSERFNGPFNPMKRKSSFRDFTRLYRHLEHIGQMVEVPSYIWAQAILDNYWSRDDIPEYWNYLQKVAGIRSR